MDKSLATILLVIMLLAGCTAWAEPSADAKVRITLFWGQGCPHCAEEKVFIARLMERHGNIELRDFEVWHNKENAKLFEQFARRSGIKQVSVPTTLVGNRLFVGFSHEIEGEIENAIMLLSIAPAAKQPTANAVTPEQPIEGAAQNSINIPLIGRLDATSVSLPLLTIIIGALDSFNPCALFVLMFLLSLMIHARSRMRMFIVGGTFVLISGLVYFMFMAAWLNFFMIAGNISAVTIVAGAVAIIAGAINVKDFFAFKSGVSLSIPDASKPKLYERMRGLIKSTDMASMLLGTVTLAVFANAYELLCTAGFPMLYTRMLTMHGLPTSTYYLYLAFYNLVYVIPLAAIVGLFVVTLGSRKLSEHEGRFLKLLSGLMMTYLGIALVVWPNVLNSVLGATGLLAAAALTALTVHLLTKRRF